LLGCIDLDSSPFRSGLSRNAEPWAWGCNRRSVECVQFFNPLSSVRSQLALLAHSL